MPKLPLPVYYIVSGVFSAFLFVLILITNSFLTGFVSHMLALGKFVPLVLLGLSILYYYQVKNNTDTTFTDTGLGFQIGKGLYYIVMLVCIVLTFIMTFIGEGFATGFLSVVLGLMSVFAVVEAYFTWVNYQTYKGTSMVVTNAAPAAPAPVVVVVPPAPPAPTPTV